jgi:hypothetical protein
MDLNKFHRGFLRIVMLLCLIGWCAVRATPAVAQQIVSASFDPTTSTLTARDSAGDIYTANLAGVGLAAPSTAVPAAFTPPGGTPEATTLTLTPVSRGVVTVAGVEPSQLSLTCTVGAVTGTASCTLATSPQLQINIAQSLAASTQGELRSQSAAVNYMITDRLRSLARSLAASTVNEPTEPGGTVILKDFSANPSSLSYGGASAGRRTQGSECGAVLRARTSRTTRPSDIMGRASSDWRGWTTSSTASGSWVSPPAIPMLTLV